MAQRTKPLPNFDEEAALIEQGYALVAGLDEVGRGTLAGPVTAAAAVFAARPAGEWAGLVRDSKQMSPKAREYVAPRLRQAAVATAVGSACHDEVDLIGIAAATRLAMRRALGRLDCSPSFLLLDAFGLPGNPTPQKPIVKGDARCFSIAAASIIAKVSRDRMMTEAASAYPGYGFTTNKGYATREHLDALRRLGPCPIHRRTFSPVRDVLRGEGLFYPSVGAPADQPGPVSRQAG